MTWTRGENGIIREEGRRRNVVSIMAVKALCGSKTGS
jgi:hypothetical protein